MFVSEIIFHHNARFFCDLKIIIISNYNGCKLLIFTQKNKRVSEHMLKHVSTYSEASVIFKFFLEKKKLLPSLFFMGKIIFLYINLITPLSILWLKIACLETSFIYLGLKSVWDFGGGFGLPFLVKDLGWFSITWACWAL